MMFKVDCITFRDNMKLCMDRITNDCEVMLVTRKDNRNVVMLSEESYNNLMKNFNTREKRLGDTGEEYRKATEETLLLMSIPEVKESIINGGNTSLEDCLSENEVEW